MSKPLKKERDGIANSLKLIFGLFIVFFVIYFLSAFTEIPVLSDMRTIWIETAMTTGEHQWLAKIYPQSVINKVMEKQINTVDEVAGISEISVNRTKNTLAETFAFPSIVNEYDKFISQFIGKVAEGKESAERLKKYWTEQDPLNQLQAKETGVDDTGREVLYNDIEQGIMISKVKTSMYVGRVVQICDPSRVFIATTDKKEEAGTLICDYLEKYDAILGVNASGFKDYNGQGLGGEIIGQTRSQGEDWGTYINQITIGFDDQNRLIAGQIDDWDEYNLRDAIQFNPVLIKDGTILTEGSSGWGLQPRTIIGQRYDGAVLFMVVDGRKIGYSIGATMGDCAEVLLEYGVVTAAACDGGSSSVIAYDGEIINPPSTPMITGRYLPNAFLVKTLK